ncbi:MAG: hypothetical protein ACYC6F_17300 [Longimicrobiales bacterium]
MSEPTRVFKAVGIGGVLHVVREDGACFYLRPGQKGADCEDVQGRWHHIPDRVEAWVELPPVPGTPAVARRSGADL